MKRTSTFGYLALAVYVGGFTWLTEPQRALDLPGPAFVAHYAVLFCVSLAATLFFRWWARWPITRPPTAANETFTPFELAYLRGGAAGVIQAAVAALVHRGRIAIDGADIAVTDAPPRKRKHAAGAFRGAWVPVDESPIEQAILDTIVRAGKRMGIVYLATLLRNEPTRTQEARLVAHGLLHGPKTRATLPTTPAWPLMPRCHGHLGGHRALPWTPGPLTPRRHGLLRGRQAPPRTPGPLALRRQILLRGHQAPPRTPGPPDASTPGPLTPCCRSRRRPQWGAIAALLRPRPPRRAQQTHGAQSRPRPTP